MGIQFVQADAFAEAPFTGNPAGVVLLADPAPEVWMRAVAAEINASETAFLHRTGESRFTLRWFTPRVEVRLCGHATLASAHVLWETYGQPGETLSFDTWSGLLRAERADDLVLIDLPAIPAEPAGTADRDRLLEVLRKPSPREVVQGKNGMWLVQLPDASAVCEATPDLGQLAALDGDGLIITARAGPSADVAIVSRYFAPHVGIPEDPVTGSAHCLLAPYWATRLGIDSFSAEQASERGGKLRVTLIGERVHLTGRVITTLKGEIMDGPHDTP